jgi:hypothetical protein
MLLALADVVIEQARGGRSLFCPGNGRVLYRDRRAMNGTERFRQM